MPIPIVLPITDFTRRQIAGAKAVALTNAAGVPLAILRTPETFELRVREIISRTWGVIDDAQRMFVIRTSDPIEVRRGDSVGVDVEVQASFPVLAEWLVRGTSWRTLQDDGRMRRSA